MPRRVRLGVSLACAVAALGVGAVAARAQRGGGVPFSAEVSTTQAGLDEEIQLTFHISLTGGQRVGEFRPPNLREFEIRDTAVSNRVQLSLDPLGNTPQHVRMEDRVFLLRPRRVGTATIGEAILRVGNREYRTRPIQIRVAPSNQSAPPPRQGPMPVTPRGMFPPGFPIDLMPRAEPPRPDRPDRADELLLIATADRHKVYLGQQLTVSWYVYTQSPIDKYRPIHEPKIEAFWTQDLMQPQRLTYERVTHQGQEYLRGLLMKRALFPLRSGSHVVGSLEGEFISQASLFVAPTGTARKSAPLTIEVLPLPAGQPKDFDPAAVGNFAIGGSLDRPQVAAGEAITLKLVIQGRGNLRQLKPPPLRQLDGFKVYEPKVQDQIEPGDVVSGIKTVEYLLVPTRSGELTIPPVTLPYFDPDLARYETAATGPLRVTVVGEAPRGAAPQATAGPAENRLLPDIALIRNRPRVATRVDRVLVRPPWLALIFGTPPLIVLGLVIAGRLGQLWRRETPRSRLRRARSGARRRLRAAELLIRSGAEKVGPAFFAELAKAIHDHLEVVVGQSVLGLTMTELLPFLLGRGVPEDTARAAIRELEVCDFARFAPAAADPEELRAALRRVRELLDELEHAPTGGGARGPA